MGLNTFGIVHVYSVGEAYEEEFITAEGLQTLTAADAWPMAGGELLHVREVAPLAA